MRGYFAIYNDTIYELEGHDMTPRNILSTEESHVLTNTRDEKKEVNTDITISNLTRNSDSNATLFKTIVEKIQTEKITDITSLSPVYKMYVDYALRSIKTGEIVDQGVLVKEIPMFAGYFSLGLTEENEFVNRLCMSADAGFERYYRSPLPYGIMKREIDHYQLQIAGITLVEVGMEAFELSPRDFHPRRHDRHRVKHPRVDKPYYERRPCDGRFDYIYNRYDNLKKPQNFEGHPSIQKLDMTSTVGREYDVVIFDSSKEGIVIDPIEIKFRPNLINININLVFNNYLVTGDRDDIYHFIVENQEPDEPEIITPPEPDEETGGETTDTPIVVPDGSDGTTNDDENSENTDDTTDDGTDDGTEDGGDNSENTDDTTDDGTDDGTEDGGDNSENTDDGVEDDTTENTENQV